MDDKEPFLARWSRRKLDAQADESVAGAQAVESRSDASAEAHARAADAAAAKSAQVVTPEYREFFDPQVDEQLRRTALKKLFSEPQFNVMDGLDTYVDDYSKPEPIPPAMLRQMNQAKHLLFDDERQAGESAGDTAAAEGAAAAVPVAAAGTGALPQAPAAGAPDDASAAATGAAAPAADGSRNS